MLIATLVGGFCYVLLGGARPATVILPIQTDPGHEDSATGWWCVNAGLPDVHRPESPDGEIDHACSSAEITNACRYWGELLRGGALGPNPTRPEYCQ